jgi:ankyrin repeat protein
LFACCCSTTHDGVDVNSKCDDGSTAFTCAIIDGNEAVVRELLKHDRVNVNAKEEDGSTASILPSVEGHEAIVHEMLKHDRIDVNITNSNGGSAFSGQATLAILA